MEPAMLAVWPFTETLAWIRVSSVMDHLPKECETLGFILGITVTREKSQTLWYMPVVITSQEVEAGGSQI